MLSRCEYIILIAWVYWVIFNQFILLDVGGNSVFWISYGTIPNKELRSKDAFFKELSVTLLLFSFSFFSKVSFAYAIVLQWSQFCHASTVKDFLQGLKWFWEKKLQPTSIWFWLILWFTSLIAYTFLKGCRHCMYWLLSPF